MEIRNTFGQNIPCWALWDIASQLHFITERCVQTLRLSRSETNAQIQGISSVNTDTYQSVSTPLTSKPTDWHTTLNCAILSHITGTTPSTKMGTNTWKIPKDINLAVEEFDQPAGIDPHIGADKFNEMLRSDRRTRPGNYPVLQVWVLDWTLTGHIPGTAFLLRVANILKHKLNRFWWVEPVEQSNITTEQLVCEQHFITHTTQQQDGRIVVRLPTKVDTKQNLTTRLSA